MAQIAQRPSSLTPASSQLVPLRNHALVSIPADRLPEMILPLLPPLQIHPGRSQLVESPRPVLSRSSEELRTTTDLGKGKGSTQALKHSSTQALEHSSTRALKHSSTQALKHSSTQGLKDSRTQALQHSNTPTLKHSNTQALQRSSTSAPQYSSTAALQLQFSSSPVLESWSP
jgi:hypothetical protein